MNIKYIKYQYVKLNFHNIIDRESQIYKILVCIYKIPVYI